MDIVTKSGSWYSYNGAKIAQGRDAAKQFLLDNPEMMDELEAKIKAKFANDAAPEEVVEEVAEAAEAKAK